MAEIQVYGASWCPDCLRAKKFLTEQRVPFDWFDIERNPRLVRIVEEKNDGKHVIPTVVFADGSHLSEPTNEELADRLGLVRTAAQHLYDLVIVGGGPAGLTTAIYAARENIETMVVERSGLGGQAGITNQVENYPGFPDGVGGGELADRFVDQARRYGVELLQAVGVAKVERDPDGVVVVQTRAGEHYHARAVLVATGSSYRRLMVPGEEELIGGGIHFCATCDGPFYRGASELVVVGGGNSGLEEGLFLTEFAEMVTVVEFNPALKASGLLQDKVLEDPKMRVLTNHRVTEFRASPEGKLDAVMVEDRASGVAQELRPAAVFVFIGLDPNTAFLKGTVDLDPEGFVVTDRTLSTSVPGVFAAGDVRAGSTKQLASAVGEGAAAALSIRAYLESVR
ncbi:MAG: FAD-dependent oxidoreductase [Actinomycetota bacterium]|nr:FAD-dependent oxidoreductase [Actinomycetota bacterium]